MQTHFFILIAVLAIGFSSCSTPKTTAQFYNAHKHKEDVINFKLPGWLVWIGGTVAQPFVKDREVKAGLKMARKIKKVRFLVAEDYNPIAKSEINGFLNGIRQNGYEDLFYVKSEGVEVQFLAREKKDKLNNIVMLVSEENQFVYFDIKSRIKYKDLSKIINFLMEAEGDGPIQEEAEDEKPAAKKIPQA